MKFLILFLQTTTNPHGLKYNKKNELDLQNGNTYKVGNKIISKNI